jgi:hypothetical protein
VECPICGAQIDGGAAPAEEGGEEAPAKAPEPEPEPEPAPEPIREPEPEPEPAREQEPEPEPMAEFEAEPETRVEPEPEAEPELEAEPEPSYSEEPAFKQMSAPAPGGMEEVRTEVMTEAEVSEVRKSIMSKLIEWSAQGYVVEELQKLVEEDEDAAAKQAEEIEAGIVKIEKLRKKLSEMDVRNLESQAREVIEMMANPLEAGQVETMLSDLAKACKLRDVRDELAQYKQVKGLEKDVTKVEGVIDSGAEMAAIEKEMKKLKIRFRESAFSADLVASLEKKKAATPAVKIEVQKEEVKKRTPMEIEDVFLLYKDMRLISHHTKVSDSERDPKFKFKVLKGLRDYCRKPGALKPAALNQTSHEGRNLLMQAGAEIVIGMSVKGEVHVLTEKVLQRVIEIIEKKWADDLSKWSAGQGQLSETGKVMNSLMVAFAKLSG